jgi:hypothetical protein
VKLLDWDRGSNPRIVVRLYSAGLVAHNRPQGRKFDPSRGETPTRKRSLNFFIHAELGSVECPRSWLREVRGSNPRAWNLIRHSSHW